MCAGVPPTGMVPQWGTAVVDPGMVTGVMAAEETNPWSAAKRVEALMSSPQTPVKELTYPTLSQDLLDRADAREKEKYEELKQHMMEAFQRGKTEIQQDRDNWLATREEKHARERVQEAEEVTRALSQVGGLIKLPLRSRRTSSRVFPWGHLKVFHPKDNMCKINQFREFNITMIKIFKRRREVRCGMCLLHPGSNKVFGRWMCT